MENEILINGDLHTYSPMTHELLKPEGVIIHVKGDAHFHSKDDDFIYNGEVDLFVEDVFTEYDVKDIIAYSTKFKENQ